MRHLPAAALSLVFRYACYGVMVWLALWAEARPAPTLPDVVLEHVPYVAWVDRWNYIVWIVAYVPVAIAFFFTDGARFVRYMVSSGLVALVRGVCIAVTGLGPISGPLDLVDEGHRRAAHIERDHDSNRQPHQQADGQTDQHAALVACR